MNMNDFTKQIEQSALNYIDRYNSAIELSHKINNAMEVIAEGCSAHVQLLAFKMLEASYAVTIAKALPDDRRRQFLADYDKTVMEIRDKVHKTVKDDEASK